MLQLHFCYSLSLSLSLSLLSLSAYSCQVVPLLVAKCDEATLNTLAKDVLATPLPDLLRESLPACMVLILSTYSEQRWEAGEGGEPVAVSEEEKKTALNSHNLLTQILSEEVSQSFTSLTFLFTK